MVENELSIVNLDAISSNILDIGVKEMTKTELVNWLSSNEHKETRKKVNEMFMDMHKCTLLEKNGKYYIATIEEVKKSFQNTKPLVKIMCRDCGQKMLQFPHGILAFTCNKCKLKAEVHYMKIPEVKLKKENV